MKLAWLTLLLAGLFEIGWPLGLKLASRPGYAVLGPVISRACMLISGTLLWLSLKHIPIGTAYAIWTGIGAAGSFILGVIYFSDPSDALRWLGVAAIIGGVILLKISAN